MHINDLPPEVLVEILMHVNGCTLGTSRRVCRKWKNVIDDTEVLWEKACRRDYPSPSWVANKKAGESGMWYYIYKNLTRWATMQALAKCVREFRQFYKFSGHDSAHALDVDYGILPLRDNRGIVLYDLSNLRYVPVVVPERDCIKIAHDNRITVMLLRSGILLQRTISSLTFMTQGFFQGQDFVIDSGAVYYYNNRDVYEVDCTERNLEAKHIMHCDYDIKEIQHNNGILSLFTECGNIVTMDKYRRITVKPINCPPEWVKQIRHIRAISDKNFVCFSRNLFQIETELYRHLYLDFPTITALFFYGDFVLMGTRAGEILLYRLSSQVYKSKPIFEKIADLPEGKYAVQLDVCERKTGPVIVASTFYEIIILEIDFFPHERRDKASFSSSKMPLYKRLLILRDRLRLGVPPLKAIA